MQTFLPYGPVFEANARVLDDKRLGKQRVEALQILKANDAWYLGMKSGWQNHPATKMWRMYDAALYLYTLEMCDAWVERGFTDNVRKQLSMFSPSTYQLVIEQPEAAAMPPWIDNPMLMHTHRCNLVRKNPDHYRMFWDIDKFNTVEYFWPVQ